MKRFTQGGQEKWVKADRNTVEGGTEVDSCLIKSGLISKKSLKTVIQRLSKLGHSWKTYIVGIDCMVCIKAPCNKGRQMLDFSGFCNEMNAFKIVKVILKEGRTLKR